MKREYVGMIFILGAVSLIIFPYYLFDFEVKEYLSKFIVIWLLIAYYVGQYSMKFPKAF